MSTRFFTNKDENTLLNKFEGVFQNTNIHNFDILVGYFRSSGYFRIRHLLDKLDKIRILVGIDVDHLISEAARNGLEFNFNQNITREEYLKQFQEDLQQADYSEEVENGILQFVDDITRGRIEIKAHPNKNIHAKIYIFRPENWNEHNPGSVITGSSNLSTNGIEKNFEFNVLLPYFEDVVYATTTFNELWSEAIDILPSTLQESIKKSYLSEEFTPYQIYIKLLIEYFGLSIEYDPESISDLPKGYKKLAYQMDAVNDGYNKLIKHNGFILADVVGLGKTIIATIIAQKYYYANGYNTKILIIYPPAVEKAWKKTIRDFRVNGVTFITNGSLHKIQHPEDFDLVIVDEAHKFRSDGSTMFNQLQKICKTQRRHIGLDTNPKKKVILMTATPLNNRPEDIRNQLYLFQDAKDSTLEIGNLQHFFRPLIDSYEKLKKEPDPIKVSQGVKEISNEIRTKVLESVIVRRTRTDIMQTPAYKSDIEEQGVTFPKINPPRKILYQLSPDISTLYDKTLATLKDTVKGLGYYRYQAIRYLNKDASKRYLKETGVNLSQAERISEQLSKIMKTLLVKRIDSSFHAFRMSLHRFRDANKAMLQMLDEGTVYFAPKLNINEFILNDRQDDLNEIYLENDDPAAIQVFKTEEFTPDYIQKLRYDDTILQDLMERWDAIGEYDTKYDMLVHMLKTELLNKEINLNNKVVIFSESKETTGYILRRLTNDGFTKILSVDSSNAKDLVEVIAHNFDANSDIKKNDFNIIITTEVLAEGVNLHQSNVIVNYDIPWNATRLMQRIGRVNRIGSPSDQIFIYNFFPTEQADNEIELNKKAFMKLQAFHSALGEDSQIYSTDEDYNSFGLFEELPEEEKDERLEFLNFIRQFKDQNPEEYQHIKNKIPKKARCARKNRAMKGQTISFIKNNKRDAYFLIHDNSEIEELTFVEAARIFQAKISERAINLPKGHHTQVKSALNSFLVDQSIKTVGSKASIKQGPNEKKALAILKDQMKQEFVSNDEKILLKKAIEAIQKGIFQQLSRDINKVKKLSKQKASSRIDEHYQIIKTLNNYPLIDNTVESFEENKSVIDNKNQNYNTKIIISESFNI